MDFICELLFEVILEGLFGVTVQNPKAKTWTKTLFFVLFSQIIAIWILYSGIAAVQHGNLDGGIAIVLMGTAMVIGFAAGAVHGHKRNWKQAA